MRGAKPACRPGNATYIVLKGLTADAADPNPDPSRHAPRLRPRKAIVQRQSLWIIDVLEGSPGDPRVWRAPKTEVVLGERPGMFLGSD